MKLENTYLLSGFNRFLRLFQDMPYLVMKLNPVIKLIKSDIEDLNACMCITRFFRLTENISATLKSVTIVSLRNVYKCCKRLALTNAYV